MSFAVSDSNGLSITRQQIDKIYSEQLGAARTQLSGPGGIAYRVALLSASQREKYQLASAKWRPAYEQLVAALQNWMNARNQLYKIPEAQWEGQGELLVESGQRLVNSIHELHRNVTNADWGRTLQFLEISTRAAASVPKIAVAGAKYVVTQSGEVIATAGEAIGKGGAAIGRGLAATLGPLKWYLIGAGVLVVLFYSAPIVKMFAGRSSRAS